MRDKIIDPGLLPALRGRILNRGKAKFSWPAVSARGRKHVIEVDMYDPVGKWDVDAWEAAAFYILFPPTREGWREAYQKARQLLSNAGLNADYQGEILA
ncbi:MAG: hypothetical protein M3H12_02625 [Chromatiales bacterium]|nr:hypothetical protein [Gammaproteobacteria bacterium]